MALQFQLLADTLLARRKLDEAAPLMQRALELYEERLGPEHPRSLATLKALAGLELSRGRALEAETRYRQALAIDETLFGANAVVTATDLLDLTAALELLGNWRDGRVRVDRALRILTDRCGEGVEPCARAIATAARLAISGHRYKEARGLAERLQQIQERVFGKDDPRLVGVLVLLARIAMAEGAFEEAESKFAQAQGLIGEGPSSQRAWALELAEARADLALARGNHAEREEHDRHAFALARERSERTLPRPRWPPIAWSRPYGRKRSSLRPSGCGAIVSRRPSKGSGPSIPGSRGRRADWRASSLRRRTR
jgi:tetratricopeptide (TPR) repeat protein